MKISIITVTYNSASTIKDTLDSVNSQTYANIEHIIVDGLSNDKTLEIVKEYGKRVSKIISEKDNGIYDAMNKGIKAATGEIIGILNSDDFFNINNAVELVVNEFKKDEKLDAVYSDLYFVKQDLPAEIARYWKSTTYKKGSFYKGWHPSHPTLYVKKTVYDKYGDYNTKYKNAADFEFMLRVFEKYNIKSKYINQTTIRMRLGGASTQGFSSILKQNIECINAFKINGLKAPIFYPIYRLMPKLNQFFKKDNSKIQQNK